MSKCAIIVSGGTLDEALAFETLREYEEPCVIGVDRGVEFLLLSTIAAVVSDSS